MREWDLFVVSPTDTIRTAMEKISQNRHRVVVVLDGHKVVGTVSDGDIRRAFLRDILPIAPVEHVMNLNCRTTTERDPKKLQRALRREQVTVLPVVNEENELVDVALAYEPFAKGKHHDSQDD
jgi:CBS domain-containing protein